MKAYQIPAGDNGLRGRKAQMPYAGFLLISKNMMHPEIFFTYQNYLMDNYAVHKQGSEFEFGLAKGYDWDVVDGQVTMDSRKIKDFHQTIHYTLMGFGAQVPDFEMNMRKTVKNKLRNGQPLTEMNRIYRLSPRVPLPILTRCES